MTWHATVMPDDALDPESLVGRMLRHEPVIEPYKLATVEPEPTDKARIARGDNAG